MKQYSLAASIVVPLLILPLTMLYMFHGAYVETSTRTSSIVYSILGLLLFLGLTLYIPFYLIIKIDLRSYLTSTIWIPSILVNGIFALIVGSEIAVKLNGQAVGALGGYQEFYKTSQSDIVGLVFILLLWAFLNYVLTKKHIAAPSVSTKVRGRK